MTDHGTLGWHRPELAYCSNVHAGETLAEVIANVQQHVSRVRELRTLPDMASGLWLAAEAASTLVSDRHSQESFTQALRASGIDLVTLNGFPYGGFHAESVKQNVYQPNWADSCRYDHTLTLAGILAANLPDGVPEGTISTLPLGYRHEWSEQLQARSLDYLCRIAVQLQQLREQTGRSIRVCLEMEPDCVLESTGEAIALFAEALPAAASRHRVSELAIRQHLGICFDVCHQAVMFEDVRQSLNRLRQNDIAIGKIQISSALAAADPNNEETRRALLEFDEPRYLHQVRAHAADGLLSTVDLPQALASAHMRHQPWRIHFHVPIQTASVAQGTLGTTRSDILAVLDFLRANPDLHPHLEVETYTWEVLPDGLKPTDPEQLARGLARELDWLESEMGNRGLLRELP